MALKRFNVGAQAPILGVIMPRPKKTLTGDQAAQVEALAAYLTQEQIADYFGIARNTFARIVAEDETVFERYKRGKAKAIGTAAKTVLDAIRDGNLTAAFFYLKTQAGWRETGDGAGDSDSPPLNISFSVSKPVAEIEVTRGKARA
jgi:hypothetical protein